MGDARDLGSRILGALWRRILGEQSWVRRTGDFRELEAPRSQGERARRIRRFGKRVHRCERGWIGRRECERTSGSGH